MRRRRGYRRCPRGALWRLSWSGSWNIRHHIRCLRSDRVNAGSLTDYPYRAGLEERRYARWAPAASIARASSSGADGTIKNRAFKVSQRGRRKIEGLRCNLGSVNNVPAPLIRVNSVRKRVQGLFRSFSSSLASSLQRVPAEFPLAVLLLPRVLVMTVAVVLLLSSLPFRS